MPQSIKDKVKALEKKNRLITESLVDAVWVIDADTLKYEYITPSIQKISGHTPEELMGRIIFERMTPESSKMAASSLIEGLKNYKIGKPATQSLELELKKKNGDTYWVEVRAKLAEEAEGPPKIIGITRDITIRKKAELQLEQMNRELTAALAEKETLSKEIKILRNLLPICSGCKRIRDDEGKWWPLDEFIRSHSDTDFTHTICPDCRVIFYPDLNNQT